MKHDLKITLVMIAVFVIAQLVGLFGVMTEHDTNPKKYAPYATELPEGAKDLTGSTNIPDSPQLTEAEKVWTWVHIMIAILLGTALAFILIKLKAVRLFKVWFFVGIGLCLSFAISPFIALFFDSYIPVWNIVAPMLATVIGFLLAGLRLWRYNVFVHNITEILLYGGLAILVQPLVNIRSAFILLIAISIYDMYAVWRSKHMITLAQSQMENRIFSGVMIPYQAGTGKIIMKSAPKSSKPTKKVAAKTAILGGGDIAFPLIFASAVMTDNSLLWYFSQDGLFYAAPLYWFGALIVLCAAVALTLLFFYGKKDRFYPAMPYITAGCFSGYIIGLFILLGMV